jgi:hypothetical protein
MEEPVKYTTDGKVLSEKTYEKLAEVTDLDIQKAVKKWKDDKVAEFIAAKPTK